jgi:8-oxo-dGTP pyrophosphatase MutT (NUDIX family)
MSRDLDRAIAIAVFRRGDEILVSEVPDPMKNETGWRPPGGGIEFGERGAETVVREIDEELGVRVVGPRYLGTLENIFMYLGVPGHQLVRVYEAVFADTRLYEKESFDCVEANGIRFTCVWKPIADFRSGVPLYPTGLIDLISA